ncbi:MAG: toprim domain-containing protein [Planctomycetaceae bacterium]|nr:toprim domain-containing protein [Planctomycetaceae bacterium]
MNNFSFDIKEQVRDAVDIVEFVSRYIPLRRSGRHYVGKCPWHDDSRPSLQVNAERQSYKCWVCNLGGDIFSFVMQMEGVEFREALEILADHAGIPLKSTPQITYPHSPAADPSARPQPQDTGGTNPPSSIKSAAKEPITKKTFYRALDWAANKYHNYFLAGSEAESARKYIEERGINAEQIRKFKIGYAPLQRDWIITQTESRPEQIRVLEWIGNLVRGENDGPGRVSLPYDRFRGRVLFPIVDTQDRTVAFGGRILPDSPLPSKAKYLNSPETPLFSKHKMLYGLDTARLAMRKSSRALIMEGYTDVIIAHQFGFEDSVAVLGTALGTEHIRLLSRFAEKMVLVLDGDDAGRKRAEEVLHLFVAQGADIEILTLPDGNDPCEFLLNHGSEAFRGLLEHNTADALEHAFQNAVRDIDLHNDVVGATRAMDKILTIIAQAPATNNPADPQRLRLEKTIQRLSERFGLSEKHIRDRLKELHKQQSERPRYETVPRRMPMQNPAANSVKDGQIPKTAEPYRDGVIENEDAETIPDEILFDKVLSCPEENPVTAAPDAVPLPPIPWELSGILPDALEKDLIEAWLIDPHVFDILRDKIPESRFLSPVTKQIFQVCCEFSDHGNTPTFERLMTRFDDTKMKSYLVERDENAAEKQLTVNDRLIMEMIDGFERRHLERSKPKDIGRLRADGLSTEEKLNLLLEIQQKQRARHGITEPREG